MKHACVTILTALAITTAPRAEEIHVSPVGPIATLEAARDAVRAAKATSDEPIEVVIHEGRYVLTNALALGPEDAGTAELPIVWRAEDGAKVTLTGAVVVPAFSSVDDDVRERLAPAARDHVMQADLKALAIEDYGSPEGGGLQLIFRDEPMTLARWPNEGFVEMKEVVGDTPIEVHGRKGFEEGVWLYEDDRHARWADEADPWVHGYWFWDWSDQRHRVASIDPEAKRVEVEAPYHGYGYRNGQWYYAYNLLSEIDQPGEWYLNRDTGVLYFWPPADVTPGDALVTVTPELLNVSNTSHIEFRGMRLEGARRAALIVHDSDSIVLSGATVAHIGDNAVRVSGGTNNRVEYSSFYHLNAGAIGLTGGDRETLTPANHAAIGNHIHHYGRWYRMYRTAVSLSGVGLRAAHNHIHDAPHMAIGFSGNDHLIEYNHIHDVCLESNDAGAIYAGRDWTMRGTKVRYNYMHDIQGFRNEGAVGVYLDDMFCGTEITGNVFYRVTRAAFIGGGRDVTIANNLFVDCDPALHLDGRAMNWASYHVETTMTDRLKAMPYETEPWKSRYPELLELLEDEPAAPKGNRVEQNIAIGGRWNESYKPAPEYISPLDNVVLDADAARKLLDALEGDHDSATDFRILLNSVEHPHSFSELPLERMGPPSD